MKKLLAFLFIFVLFMTSNIITFGVNTDIYFAEEGSEVGLVGVYFNNTNNQKRMRLLVEKDGERYTYNINKEEDIQQFPLQLGNGNYTVRIMENVEGNSYRTLSTKFVELQLQSQETVFLNSIQEIKWNQENKAIKKAKELTAGLTTDEEKVNAIYNYIIKTISYDYEKIGTLTSLYLPNIDSTLEDGQGICYDYSALFAAMLRSQGIPTKMIKGYTTEIPNEYHAWNEVLVGGEWKIVDTTFDAAYFQANKKASQFKDRSKYSAEKFY